jgi:hypothetical protein
MIIKSNILNYQILINSKKSMSINSSPFSNVIPFPIKKRLSQNLNKYTTETTKKFRRGHKEINYQYLNFVIFAYSLCLLRLNCVFETTSLFVTRNITLLFFCRQKDYINQVGGFKEISSKFLHFLSSNAF